MALAKVPWCDFMIYTFKDHTIQRIRFDSEFWDSIKDRLTEFYFKYILPKACMYVAIVLLFTSINLKHNISGVEEAVLHWSGKSTGITTYSRELVYI